MTGIRTGSDASRGAAIAIIVDGESVPAFEGETIAAAMLSAGRDRFRTDAGGARGMFCNMGTCAECMVTLAESGRRVRACQVEARDGLEILTDG